MSARTKGIIAILIAIFALTGCGGNSHSKAHSSVATATHTATAQASARPTAAPTTAKPLVPATCTTTKLVITSPQPETKVNGHTGTYVNGKVCLPPGGYTLWAFDSSDKGVFNFDSPTTPGNIGPISGKSGPIHWHDYEIGDDDVIDQPNTITLVSADPECLSWLNKVSATPDGNGDTVAIQSQMPSGCKIIFTVTVKVTNKGNN